MHTVEWKPKMIYSCLMREIARFNFPMCVFSCHIVVNFGLIVRFMQVVFRPLDVFHGSCHHGLRRSSLRSSASLRSCACRSSSSRWRLSRRAKKVASLSGFGFMLPIFLCDFAPSYLDSGTLCNGWLLSQKPAQLHLSRRSSTLECLDSRTPSLLL